MYSLELVTYNFSMFETPGSQIEVSHTSKDTISSLRVCVSHQNESFQFISPLHQDIPSIHAEHKEGLWSF